MHWQSFHPRPFAATVTPEAIHLTDHAALLQRSPCAVGSATGDLQVSLQRELLLFKGPSGDPSPRLTLTARAVELFSGFDLRIISYRSTGILGSDWGRKRCKISLVGSQLSMIGSIRWVGLSVSCTR